MVAGKPVLNTVSVDSVSVDSYKAIVDGKTFIINNTQDSGPIKYGTLYLSRAVDTVLDMSAIYYKEVVVQRGVNSATEQYMFRGVVIDVDEEPGLYRLRVADKLILTTKRKITKSFDYNNDPEQGVYSEIAKTIINDYSSLTADSNSVQNSGTAAIIKKYRCRNLDVYTAVMRLMVAIGWNVYYDPESDKVNMEPKGYENQTTTLETGVNIARTPKWQNSGAKIYNKVQVNGAVTETETTETGQIGVTTGYGTTAITLQNKPQSVKLYLDSSNPPTTLRSGGKQNVTTSYDYSIDVDNKALKFDSTYTPNANDYAIVQYSYYVPTPVVVEDATSRDLYTNGEFAEIVLEKPEIENVDDAEAYATQFLADSNEPVSKSRLIVTNVSDLQPGQTVPVNDTENGKSGSFYVVSVQKTIPYSADEVTVLTKFTDEDVYDFNIKQRTKRLEEENLSDTEGLLHIKSATRETKKRRRYAIKYKKDRSSDGVNTFILGHPVFGVLGTQELGDAGTADAAVAIVQGNNTYEEHVYDTDFYNSGSSTGITWNTTTNVITFAAGGVLYTNQLALGTQYSYFTLTRGAITGSMDIEISQDNGTTWQTVTPGTRQSFNHVGTTGVILRVTETATAAATIETVKENGLIKNSAIKLILE